MKKINLEFRKEVISTLSGNELSQIQGGNTAFSYNSCPTVDGPCTASSECTDQDSWQGKCLSDLSCRSGSGSTEPQLDHKIEKGTLVEESGYCVTVPSFDTICQTPSK